MGHDKLNLPLLFFCLGFIKYVKKGKLNTSLNSVEPVERKDHQERVWSLSNQQPLRQCEVNTPGSEVLAQQWPSAC